MMRPFIQLALVLLLSCSAKNDTTEKDIATEAIDDLRPTEPKEVVVDNGYLLDSLLNFDSEEELMKLFHQDITRAVGYYPEGMGEYQNTLLFQGTTNQVEFVWRDDSVNFSGLSFVIVRGKETDWRTAEGITLGTKLKELESLNRKPFTFYGFGWDYGGAADWDGGELQERNIFVSLEYPEETMPSRFEGLIGDYEIRSDSDIAQQANPIVVEIKMRK